jgi:hypothetical protein
LRKYPPALLLFFVHHLKVGVYDLAFFAGLVLTA